MSQGATLQDTNKALVRASFDRWAHGTEFPEEVIHRFNARMSTPLVR
jgi:hypothetical protein